LDARKNVFCSVTTFPTFHPVKSAFISLASSKVLRRVVAEVVSHALNPVPENLVAKANVLSSAVTLAVFHEREEVIGDGRWEMGDGRWEMGDEG
jgi:hypothetical protein